MVRELSDLPSNWRSRGGLEDFLRDHEIPAIVGRRHAAPDAAPARTRRVARRFRSRRHRRGAARGERGARHGRRRLRLRGETREAYSRGGGRSARGGPGLRHQGHDGTRARPDGFASPSCRPVPVRTRFSTTGQTVSSYPTGPETPRPWARRSQSSSRSWAGFPIFGICLGHQLLADALGGSTFKLPFGHHGVNHPVQDLATGRIEITAQNHNYAVTPDSLERAVVSHLNLNDGVIEGISAPGERCFSVQYHPEAGPGPHDARYLFERFESLLRTNSLEER